MTNDATDHDLLAALQSGDDAAAERIFCRYYERLIGLVSQNYSNRVARTESDSDVVQSVFRSFFRRGAAQEFRIADDGSLWPILVTIALNKIRNRAKFWSRKKRDIRRTAGIEELSGILSREPSPEEAAVLQEVITDLLGRFSERRRRILELLLEGCSLTEVMETLGTTRFTVAGTRKAAAEVLEQVLGAEVGRSPESPDDAGT